jgi:hypothetical protein
VDGIVAGEGNGPMAPDSKPCGLALAGTHPVAVDCVAAELMGFDWGKLRLLRGSFHINQLSFVPFQAGDIRIISNRDAWRGTLAGLHDTFQFRPHFGWVGAVERLRATPEPASADRGA